MPSNANLARGMAILQAAFPRDVTDDVTAVYRLGLADLSEDQYLAGINACVKECRYFPTVSEIRERAGLNKKVAIDTDAALGAISALGSYNPNVGWLYPRVEAVRAAFGDAVGAAYGMAGAARCFSDNEVSRDIARRVFSEELQGSRQAEIPGAFVIGPHLPNALLTDGDD